MSKRLLKTICMLVFMCVLILDYSSKVTVGIVEHVSKTEVSIFLLLSMVIATISFVIALQDIYAYVTDDTNIGIKILVGLTGVNFASVIFGRYLNLIKASDVSLITAKCRALTTSATIIGVVNLILILLIRGLVSPRFRCKGIRDRVMIISTTGIFILILLYTMNLYHHVYVFLKANI